MAPTLITLGAFVSGCCHWGPEQILMWHILNMVPSHLPEVLCIHQEYPPMMMMKMHTYQMEINWWGIIKSMTLLAMPLWKLDWSPVLLRHTCRWWCVGRRWRHFVAPPSDFTLYCVATKGFGFQFGVPTTRCLWHCCLRWTLGHFGAKSHALYWSLHMGKCECGSLGPACDARFKYKIRKLNHIKTKELNWNNMPLVVKMGLFRLVWVPFMPLPLQKMTKSTHGESILMTASVWVWISISRSWPLRSHPKEAWWSSNGSHKRLTLRHISPKIRCRQYKRVLATGATALPFF